MRITRSIRVMVILCVLSPSLPALAASGKRISTQVIELLVRRVPKIEVFGADLTGTIVVVSLRHTEKELLGIDFASSRLTLKDDLGNDLIVQAKAVKKTKRKSRAGFIIGGNEKQKNTFSIVRRSIFDKEIGSKEIRFRAHAQITPGAKAKGLVIRGTMVLLVKPKTNKTAVVSAADLIAGKSFELGGQRITLKKNGSGLYGGERFVAYRLRGALRVQKMTVEDESSKKPAIRFRKIPGDQSAEIMVFEKLKRAQKIKVEYVMPEKETVNVYIKIGPGFGFVSK